MEQKRIVSLGMGIMLAVIGVLLFHQQHVIRWLELEQTRANQEIRDKRLKHSALIRKMQLLQDELQSYRDQAREVHALRNTVAQQVRAKLDFEERINLLTKEKQSLKRGWVFEGREIIETNERLDVAIRGVGFFEVQLSDGSLAYTRDGSFKLDPDGRISTRYGLHISGFPLFPPDTKLISIAPNGEVSASTGTNGENAQNFRFAIIRFSNPNGLAAVGRAHLTCFQGL